MPGVSDIRRFFTSLGWWTAAIAAALVILALWAALTWGDRQRQAAARAGAAATIAAAQAGSAADAIARQDQALNAAQASGALTTESDHAIHQAPGADQALDPQLNRTGVERLCLRAAYRDDPRCLQQSGRAHP